MDGAISFKQFCPLVVVPSGQVSPRADPTVWCGSVAGPLSEAESGSPIGPIAQAVGVFWFGLVLLPLGDFVHFLIFLKGIYF